MMFLYGMFLYGPLPIEPKDQPLYLKVAGVQIAVLILIATFGH